MFLKALIIGIWAWINGGVFVEFCTWTIKGAPLMSGAITGLLLGDWKAGAMIGATIQLLYMGQITVGGVASFDKCYAGVVATALTIVSNQEPEIGITLAVSLGSLGLIAANAKKAVNVIYVHMADKYAEEGNTKMIWVCNWLLPQMLPILLYGIPAFLLVYFGATYLEGFIASLPAFILTALKSVGKVLPALGISLMLKAVYKPSFIPFAMIGYLCVAYLKFDIIACTILGTAFALLYMTLGSEKVKEIE